MNRKEMRHRGSKQEKEKNDAGGNLRDFNAGVSMDDISHLLDD